MGYVKSLALLIIKNELLASLLLIAISVVILFVILHLLDPQLPLLGYP